MLHRSNSDQPNKSASLSHEMLLAELFLTKRTAESWLFKMPELPFSKLFCDALVEPELCAVAVDCATLPASFRVILGEAVLGCLSLRPELFASEFFFGDRDNSFVNPSFGDRASPAVVQPSCRFLFGEVIS